ncbi:kinesin-like protein Klp5 [Chytriomyces hyalinus]|nr:kinesin-like protein Klp5 [Chytriomyces hyalinus]
MAAKNRSSSNNNNITVAVRVRPLLRTESESVVHVVDGNILSFDNRRSSSSVSRSKVSDIRFAFDRVFGPAASQESVFDATAKPLVDLVVDGFNATVFAYGATGCGKTHTITGTPSDPGIIHRTMTHLFTRINQLSETQSTFKTTVSYLEVYNETIRDLLVTSSNRAPQSQLDLREDDEHRRVTVSNLSEHSPKSVEDVIALMELGNSNRIKAFTEANAVSSRSHAVLQVCIERRDINSDTARGDESNVASSLKVATLSIIDLAGSERASATQNKGERLLEGANINRSLLALGNCINALCSDKPNHIPYRDSKLTRLLKYSLGGNCKVVMITNISPSSTHNEETHNTLKYANRAKNIQTKVEQNTINLQLHISQYPKIIQGLQLEISQLKSQLASGVSSMQPVAGTNTGAVTDFQQLQRYNKLVSKLSTVHQKMTQKQLLVCETEATIARNEDRMDLLRLSLESQFTPASNGGNINSDFKQALYDTVSHAIEKLHIENVRLRHNATEYESAVNRYAERMNRTLQSAAGESGQESQDGMETQPLSLLYREKLEAAVLMLQARAQSEISELKLKATEARLQDAKTESSLFFGGILSCLGKDGNEHLVATVKSSLEGAFGIVFKSAGQSSGAKDSMEDVEAYTEAQETWEMFDDSVSECDVSLSYDNASETESECGDMSFDCTNMLDELDDNDEAVHAAFNQVTSQIDSRNEIAPKESENAINLTDFKLHDEFNVDDLISVVPPSPPVFAQAWASTTPMKQRMSLANSEMEEDEPTPLAKPRNIADMSFSVLDASSPMYRITSRLSMMPESATTTPQATVKSKLLEIAAAAEQFNQSSPQPQNSHLLGTGNSALGRPMSPALAPFASRLRSSKKSLLPVMKPKTPGHLMSDVIPSSLKTSTRSGVDVSESGRPATRALKREQGAVRAPKTPVRPGSNQRITLAQNVADSNSSMKTKSDTVVESGRALRSASVKAATQSSSLRKISSMPALRTTRGKRDASVFNAGDDLVDSGRGVIPPVTRNTRRKGQI